MKKNNERPIFNDMLDLTSDFCIRKYLRKKSASKIRNLSHLEKDFLKKNLGPMLVGKHKKSFIFFLDKIRDHSAAQIFASKIITSFYINLNESPDKKIISHIIVDDHLTSYIQTKELVDYSTLKFYQKRFRRIYKKSPQKYYKKQSRIKNKRVY